MLKKEPEFGENAKLFRFIRKIYRQNSRRAKFPAFLEAEESKKDGLSVNSGEIQTLNQIATIYAEKSGEARPLAVSEHCVDDYNVAASQVELNITYDALKRAWIYHSDAVSQIAYLHNPKIGNPSHSLVRFTRHFDVRKAQKFAMRMAYKPTYRDV